ncbi:MAG: hypothetical protein AB2434_11790, partial [Caldanaerobacter subterraneus]
VVSCFFHSKNPTIILHYGFQNIVSFIMNQSDTVKMLFIIALVLIVLTVSCLLSVKFYENREF